MENNTENQPSPQPQPNPPQSGAMDVRPTTSQPPTSLSQANTASSSPEAPEPPKSPKSRTPKIVIVVAVIVAFGLAAVATVVYLQSREEAQPLQESDASQQEAVQPATTEDVDETTKSVDEALSQTDTTQEFPEEDLSDQALGL